MFRDLFFGKEISRESQSLTSIPKFVLGTLGERIHSLGRQNNKFIEIYCRRRATQLVANIINKSDFKCIRRKILFSFEVNKKLFAIYNGTKWPGIIETVKY